jgi:hypothetical protein
MSERPVTTEEALADIAGHADSLNFEQNAAALALTEQRKWLELRGHKENVEHRRNWSVFVMFFVGLQILFPAIMVFLTGAGFLDFKPYPWLLPALLLQQAVQVAALSYVVVHGLFRNGRS